MIYTIFLAIIFYVCIAHILHYINIIKNKSNDSFSLKEDIVSCYVWLPSYLTLLLLGITSGLAFIIEYGIINPILYLKNKATQYFHIIYECLHLL